MPSPEPLVLIVANRTAATPALLDAVRARAARSPCRFHLLVPASSPHGLDRVVNPDDTGREAGAEALALALPLLSEAAGQPVEGHVGSSEPLAAIEDAINTREVDEVLLSTLPRRLSKWLHLDLVSKVRGLGLPVQHVEAAVTEPAVA